MVSVLDYCYLVLLLEQNIVSLNIDFTGKVKTFLTFSMLMGKKGFISLSVWSISIGLLINTFQCSPTGILKLGKKKGEKPTKSVVL